MKYTRPKLTQLQIFALGAIRDGVVKSRYKRISYTAFWIFESEGKDITTQVKSLRKRKLVRNDWLDAARTHPMPAITAAGLAALHFIEGNVTAKYEVLLPKRLLRNGKGNLLSLS